MHDVPAIRSLLKSPDFGLVAARDGLLLFQRDPPSASVLSQTVVMTSERWEENPIAVWDDRVALLDWAVTPLGERRFRLHYTWQALNDLTELPPMFVVTRLQGVPDARIVHLPTLALHPTSVWEANQIVWETFEIVVPEDIAPAVYGLYVAWYDSAYPYAFETDDRGRVGEEVKLGKLWVGE
ncbi:MAG: hypothetical protein U9Q70_01185 [Chloroflexota bacterium]|nr:hypothetical protein [Chloroflexota bacterium]